MSFAAELWDSVQLIRQRAPLVHNITNYVVMNTSANALLALGASPIMAHALEEVADIVAIADAVVINIGTLSKSWIEAMVAASSAVSERDKPLVLDPVGAGATGLRTRVCEQLLATATPTVIRGNASEIVALASATRGTKGVDSTLSSTEALPQASELARIHRTVVSMSGATDYVTDGEATIAIENGTPLMPRVTGLGCTASALTGAFLAVSSEPLRAAAQAMAAMGIAGEVASTRAAGPGTLQVHFLDALYELDESTIRERIRVQL